MNAFGRYAEVYDLLNRDKDYEAEVAFLDELLATQTSNRSTCVEFGCGTGGHSGYLKQLGFDYTGVDLSEEMVAQARLKHPDIEFICQDMRSINLKGKFQVAMALYHVVNYLPGVEALSDFFKSTSDLLHPGGLLIIDSWHEDALLSDPPVSRQRNFNSNTLSVRRSSFPNHNESERYVDVNFNFIVTGEADFEFKEVHRMHYFSEKDIVHAAKNSNLKLVDAREWMTGEELSNTTWYATYMLRK